MLAGSLEATAPALVLVDYFDTLVTRRIDAKAVKRVVSRHVAERFAISGGSEAVSAARRAAERDCRKAVVASGGDEEHRIDQMAAQMWQLLFREQDELSSLQPTVEFFVEVFLEIELRVEVAAQVVDEDIVAAIEAVGRPVVVVSDFHFTQSLFVEMLRRKGLDSLVSGTQAFVTPANGVFVSGTVGLSKATGRLYGHVQEVLSSTCRWPEDGAVTMIGDHVVSDIANARAAGLRAVRVVRTSTADSPPSTRLVDRGRRAVTRFAVERAGPSVDRRRTQHALHESCTGPFTEMAATLFAFTRLLHEGCAADGSAPVFLAREGLILQRLFDHFEEVSPAACGRRLSSSYLVVSRRSTVLASLRPLDDEDFSTLRSRYPGLTLIQLTETLGLDVDEVFGAGSLDRLINAPVDVSQLRGHQRFAETYEAERSAQRALLEEYVTSVAGPEPDLHVVDVGWKGTIQTHLQAALPDRVVRGSYVGVVGTRRSPTALVDGGEKHGVLFDSRLPRSRHYRILRHFKSIYEFLLTAEHGSAARYVSEVVDGESRVRPILDDHPVEAAVFSEFIAPVQAELARGFEALCQLDLLSERPVLATLDDVADLHQRMLFHPTKQEIELIASMQHYENYGQIGMVDVGRRPVATWRGRLRAYGDGLRHPGRLLGSGWPPLNLWSIGLGFLVRPLGTYRRLHERRPRAN